jgi:hypothetical protein
LSAGCARRALLRARDSLKTRISKTRTVARVCDTIYLSHFISTVRARHLDTHHPKPPPIDPHEHGNTHTTRNSRTARASPNICSGGHNGYNRTPSRTSRRYL